MRPADVNCKSVAASSSHCNPSFSTFDLALLDATPCVLATSHDNHFDTPRSKRGYGDSPRSLFALGPQAVFSHVQNRMSSAHRLARRRQNVLATR